MAWERMTSTVKEIPTASKPSGKPLIALLLPHTGSLSTEFVEKMWGTLRYVPVDWCDKTPIFCKVPSLPVARNTLARSALNDPRVTHLLWVDNDHVLEEPVVNPNEALESLYRCNVPIVAGIYRAKQKIGFYYAAWTRVKVDTPLGYAYTPIEGWTGNWIKVDDIGLGFCLIKREVFEKIPEPWFHWEKDSDPSEDFYFCDKAAQAGYEIKILTDIKLSHIGELKVKTDGGVTTLDL